MRTWLALIALCFGLSASAAEKKLTLIFTGDNGGEIAPCG
jgi:hypothetical protein